MNDKHTVIKNLEVEIDQVKLNTFEHNAKIIFQNFRGLNTIIENVILYVNTDDEILLREMKDPIIDMLLEALYTEDVSKSKCFMLVYANKLLLNK